MTDNSGAEVGQALFDPYGGVITNTIPATLTDRLFTGQRFDPGTGLYDYRARFYDPLTGSFIQPDSIVPDPLDPRAWNRMGYVYGNPTNYTDPSGHCGVSLSGNNAALVAEHLCVEGGGGAAGPVLVAILAGVVVGGIARVAVDAFGGMMTPPLGTAQGPLTSGGYNLGGRPDLLRLPGTTLGGEFTGLLSTPPYGGQRQGPLQIPGFSLYPGIELMQPFSLASDYRGTFFDAFPDLEGKVWVHHAVEQQVLTRYPGAFTEAEIHSLENLRGIPKTVNSTIHLSLIRRVWNSFYREHPDATESEILDKASEIDDMFGRLFEPPVR